MRQVAEQRNSSLSPILSERSLKPMANKPILAWMPSKFTLPKLEKRDAIYVLEASQDTTNVKTYLAQNIYIPDYYIIGNYGSYSYIKYSKIVHIGLGIMPEVITDLCYKYLYTEQDGIFQLTYMISKILSPINKNDNKKDNAKENENLECTLSFGFTGNELINKIRNCVKGFKSISKTEILNYCNLLIRNKYIKSTNKYIIIIFWWLL